MSKSLFNTPINRLNTNSLKWSLYPSDVIPLWVADMDFAAPEPIIKALENKLKHGIIGYERMDPKLQEVIAERMQKLYSWTIHPESIIPVPGVLSGIFIATKAYCPPGSGMLLQTPCYPPFLRLEEGHNLVTQISPLKETSKENTLVYETDWDSFENAVHSKGVRSSMFLLCSPHNPTGIVFSRSELIKFAEICIKEDIIICSDEVFGELLIGDNQHYPTATLSREIENRTITFIGTGKQFNIPGILPGFAIIPNEKLREQYATAIKQNFIRVNSMTFTASIAAYSGTCDEWLGDLRTHLTENHKFLLKYLNEFLPGVKATHAQASFLVWLDFSQLQERGIIKGSPAKFFLEKARVALWDGKDFGALSDSYARINIGCPRSTLEEALERMRKSIGTL